MPLGAVQRVQIARQFAQRGGRAGLHGRLGRQPQVLEHQVHAETAGVVLGGRRVFHHAGPRVVQFRRPVAPGALGDDVRQGLGIQAVGHAQGQGLGRAGHQDAQEHVVADLRHLTRTRVPRMEDVLAHFFEVRPGRFQIGGRAADDEGQCARHGAARAAGHRRVDHPDATLRGGGRDLARRLGRDGAAFQDQRAAGDRGEQAVVAQVQAFDVAAGRQHGDDQVGSRNGFGRGRRRRRARPGQGLDGLRDQIEDLEPVARFQQVLCHRAAHVAQSDESDDAAHACLL